MPKPGFVPVATGTFRKLTPNELEARGYSRKSERYVNPDGEVITKRRYQESQLFEKLGRRVTLFQRAVAYARKVWEYISGAARKAAEGRRKQARRKRRARGPTPAEQARLQTLRYYGDWLPDPEYNFREEMFASYDEDVVRAYLYGE